MYLVVQRLVGNVKKQFGMQFSGPANALVSMVTVYTFICVAWVYFRSPDVETAHIIFRGILSFDNLSFADLPNKFVIVKCALLILLLLFFEVLSTRVDLGSVTLRSPAFRIVSFAAILWIIALMGSFIDSQFIYFQF